MLKNTIIAFLSISLLVKSQCEINLEQTLDGFFDEEANDTSAFVQSQIDRVKQVVKSTYVGIDSDKLRQHVSSYLELQKKRLAADVNSYVEQLKVSRKKIAKLWSSFMPTVDPISKMENPEGVLSVPAIIARNGYKCETHTIESQGYILNIHRLPRPKNGMHTSRNTILIHHGLFDSSFNWFVNGPNKSLGYVLADAGYDVWLANARGNIYGREHGWYKTNTKEFWNYSFHDIALHDMPAIIDHIRSIKGNDTIAYLGHSMGSTILFSMLSLRPEYNEKLSVGILFAPSAFLSNMKFPHKKYMSFIYNIINTAIWQHSYEVFQKDFLEQLTSICRNIPGQMATCENIYFHICGEDKEQFNDTILSNYMPKSSSMSWKTLVHYMQLVSSGEFKQFDYGDAEFNRIMYGFDTPPEYDLSKVKLNITLFWAENDNIIDEKDVYRLHEKLPSSQLYKVPYPKFNHVDYLWARDAPRLVNDKVLEILEKAMRSRY